MLRRVIIVVAVLLIAASCGGDDGQGSVATTTEEGATTSSSIAESISEMVMEAWASGEQADIDAIYAEDVRMVLDGETVAENREGITSLITGAMSLGNTYQQVGPVAGYVTAGDGDLYVATLVEVVGTAHPDGDPIVGFYRVRDGKVIRHVFIEAEIY